ncbi:MAG: hypothetical protein GTO29_12760 [Candidatus Latescibacteria bacterium]|nr:hypothetical protein [Candidatus Latescibacterota bacterium]NIO57127.1 hypothetical protein [Candidatus Latescibacterota bacterium]
MNLISMDNRRQSDARQVYRFFPKDPRFAIFALVLLIVSAFVVRRPGGMLCLLVYVLLLHSLSGASAGSIWKRSKKILLFALLAVVLNAVLVSGEPLVTVSGRQIVSKEGFSRGIYFFMQIFVLYHSTVLFVLFTSQEAVAQGISALIKPLAPKLANKMAFYAFVSIGFLPLFFEEFERIATLQRFRGGGLQGGPLQKLRGTRLLIVPLFLSAIQRSGQLAMVVELRGLRDAAGELLELGRPSIRDCVFIGVTLTVVAFCVVVLSGG